MEKQERFYFDIWIALLSCAEEWSMSSTYYYFSRQQRTLLGILRNLFWPSMKRNGPQCSIY